MTQKTGILLINLGTPDEPTIPAVRRYLDEFLMDPYVIDIPAAVRFALVKGIILRFRPRQSAEAYKKIWLPEGSPLLKHGRDLMHALQAATPGHIVVELGMRYGQPSIESALNKLVAQSVEQLIVLPLFPQYSLAATESAIQAFHRAYAKLDNPPPFHLIREFYEHPGFIEPTAKLIQSHITDETDCVLMSYHGLPARHLVKAGCEQQGRHCVEETPCPVIDHTNAHCYRAQCYATTQAIAHHLDFASSMITTSFQSRLGKTPWIKPYTDFYLPSLFDSGVRHLVVACPSFVADCLETIEEIGMQARDQWQQLGGHTFTLVPCLNAHSIWVDGIQSVMGLSSVI